MKRSIFIKSNILGNGNNDLGDILMRSFINTINNSKELPQYIIFINSGVLLCIKDSKILDTLIELENKGVKIFSCGTCLDFYNEKENLKVGIISNMNDIYKTLDTCDKIMTI